MELPPVIPDKVRVTAYYDDETRQCTSIDVSLNSDGLTAADVSAAVSAVFDPVPDAPWGPISTVSNRQLGSTEVLPTSLRLRDTSSDTTTNISQYRHG